MDISIATAQVAPDLLKPLAIVSDTIVRRSAVDREDLKPYWKSEKSHISLGDQQSYYLQVFQRLYETKEQNQERRLTGWLFLAVDLSLRFLNRGTTDETFQKLGKQDSLRHLLKSSVNM